MDKPICKYGASCYRKNPDHLKKFAHPRRDHDRETDPPPSKKQKVCVDPLPTQDLDDGSSGVEAAVPDQSCSGNETECMKRDRLIKETRRLFLVDLPGDFYHFWDFCRCLEPTNPTAALKLTLGLKLVGPYDVMAGTLKSTSWEQCVLHSRHFYDPAEMTTVLSAEEGQGFHIGYFRDDPKSGQFLLVSNDSRKNCELVIEGANIFSAVRGQVQNALRRREAERDAEALQTLDAKLVEWMTKMKGVFCEKSVKELQRQRAKEIVAGTFNKLGIVVPYDKETELGYRPLPMSDRELLKLLNKICSHIGDKDKLDQAFEPLQEVVTFVQFANDECDYGMGLELGMDLFCHGDLYFHKVLGHLLPLAYELLGREEYALICKEHLKCRNRTPL